MSSTPTRIKKDIAFLEIMKMICEERLKNDNPNDPTKVPLDFPKYIETWIQLQATVQYLYGIVDAKEEDHAF